MASNSETSTYPRYCSHFYDMITNMTEKHEDNRVVSNRGLTFEEDNDDGLIMQGKQDSALLKSTYNR